MIAAWMMWGRKFIPGIYLGETKNCPQNKLQTKHKFVYEEFWGRAYLSKIFVLGIKSMANQDASFDYEFQGNPANAS